MINYLPKKYEFVHEYCFFLHDILVSIIKEGEKNDLFSVKFKFDNNNDLKSFNPENLQDADFWFWLRNNGYENILRELSQKQVFIATLSDFCQYIYESLSCSRKARLSIAFELARKPFKENLLYLEWLLANPEEFSDYFNKGKVLEIATSKIEKNKKIKIISDALHNSKYSSWINAEFLYDLRYNKKVDYGFEKIWNKATHLITNFEEFQTENENLNFVFVDKPTMDGLWDQYYKIIPILLFHTVQIAFGYINYIGHLEILDDFLLDTRKMIGFALVMTKDAKSIVIMKSVQKILKELNLVCPFCKKGIKLNKKNLELFYEDSAFNCTICNTIIQLNYHRTV